MRKPITLMFLAMLCLSVAFYRPLRDHLRTGFNATKETVSEENEEGEEKENEGAREEMQLAKQFGSWFQSRAYPDPKGINQKYWAGWEQAEALRHQQSAYRGNGMQSGMWNPIGPTNTPGGRMLCIAIDPSNGQRLFAGSASGGVWKSTNGGTSWSAVITGYPILGVQSIIIDPSNTNNIYVGTGEVYRMDSTGLTPNPGNTTYSVWKTRGTYGIGILKSTDGGVSWNRVFTNTMDQMEGVNQLKFDPTNSNTVYSCATDGLWRSLNGGASWSKIFDVDYVSDVVVNGTTLVAAVGNLQATVKGIFRSTDNGFTWTKISSGLPASFQGYIRFSQLPATPATIVASIGISETATAELYRSTNTGTSWSALAGSQHTDWQYWFAHDCAITPGNANLVIIAGATTKAVYSISAGTKTGMTGGIHDDVHDIQFDPSNNAILYLCTDGGIWKSINATAATPSFTEKNTGLAATQFYASLGVSRTDPFLYIGGLQDNQAYMYNGATWSKVSWLGGDGTACAIDPQNDNIMLASRDARAVCRSSTRGASGSTVTTYWGAVGDSRTAFCSPLAFSESNGSVVYLASDNLHVSANSGSTFTGGGAVGTSPVGPTNYIEALHKTAITLAVSPTNSNKVYVSTSSFAQYDGDVDNLYYTGAPHVLRTLTGNTPFTQINGSGGTALPNRYITDFAISKTFDDSVFVAVGGFGTQHVYVTGNGGATWTPRGGGLPDVPFNAVLIDPVDPQVIYAAGDLGVYVSPDRGVSWMDFNNGMWDATQIFDIQYTADFNLVVATHGKGVFRGARFTRTLPVTFMSFTGQADGSTNKLQWQVGQENNLARYDIERSSDGTYYAPIGMLPAIGSPTYHFTDALVNNQSYYYRIKSVDVDNSSKYSPVVYIRRNAKEAVQLMGNPITNAINLSFAMSEASKVQLSLYDAAGKLIRQAQTNLPAGQTSYTMGNLDVLPSGTYIIEVVYNNQRWKQRLLKK